MCCHLNFAKRFVLLFTNTQNNLKSISGKGPVQFTFNLDGEDDVEEKSMKCASEKCMSSAEKCKQYFHQDYVKETCSVPDSIGYHCNERLDEIASVFSKSTNSPLSCCRIKSSSTRRVGSTSSSDSTLIYSDMTTTEMNDGLIQ